MTTSRLVTLVAALGLTLALAACGKESVGAPLPDDSAINTSTPETEESPSTDATDERPREIELDGKDPCALIPRTDWPKFEIDKPGVPQEEPNFRSPNCFYAGAGDVTLVITEGIDAWTEENRDVELEDAEPIAGFPTVTMANSVDRRACYAAVDVADGQYLMTTATPDPDDQSKPEKCDLAYQLAESAMTTLVTS